MKLPGFMELWVFFFSFFFFELPFEFSFLQALLLSLPSTKKRKENKPPSKRVEKGKQEGCLTWVKNIARNLGSNFWLLLKEIPLSR